MSPVSTTHGGRAHGLGGGRSRTRVRMPPPDRAGPKPGRVEPGTDRVEPGPDRIMQRNDRAGTRPDTAGTHKSDQKILLGLLGSGCVGLGGRFYANTIESDI
uniref:Uncharacterized protein n=1 Tax=Candidatus Kentrum eta TaxID=2126337 RepID=A0A450VCI8_9GAMM|nr:MAG: hypothetical protein BECKH772A_GA0070896_100945 [Candidatus Kentron sp. H]VFJ96648.1 MAG: hypothetical protein BECKH772B_GA0070898_100955 [Candidatus Kentron sp. H]VFK02478.1 MAG: hypothetical protein BECKH772C_GA0070978_100925 [Candidatus Kentron sp. H]